MKDWFSIFFCIFFGFLILLTFVGSVILIPVYLYGYIGIWAFPIAFLWFCICLSSFIWWGELKLS